MTLAPSKQGAVAWRTNRGKWPRSGVDIRQRSKRRDDSNKETTIITQGTAIATICTTSYSVDMDNTTTDYEEMVAATPFFIVIRF